MKTWMMALAALVLPMFLAACGTPDETEVAGQADEAIVATNCTMVKCTAGHHCVDTRRGAVCRKDKCSTDSDCRLVSDYCGGCSCLALGPTQSDPTCAQPVACFRDPCGGEAAVCVGGVCEVSSGATQ
jgi:hypothetical protein